MNSNPTQPLQENTTNSNAKNPNPSLSHSSPILVARASSTSGVPTPLKSILKRSMTTGDRQRGSIENGSRSDFYYDSESHSWRPLAQRSVHFAESPLVMEFAPSPRDGLEERARKRDKLKAWGKAFAKRFGSKKKSKDEDN